MGVASVTERDPAVSVVIATYNRARFLPETLDSVLQQRFRDFELVVVDDGSTDDTQQVLKNYSDRIRVFYQENRGPSAARNFGIRHARGQWIAIQDSDDLCMAGHLETLFGFVEKNPSYGMVFANGAYLGGLEHNRETIIPRDKSKRLAQEGVRLTDLFEKSIVRLQAALISKEALKNIGGLDENLRICMDLDLAFRIIMPYPVAYLDQVVFLYRKHEGNIGRDQERRLLENIRIIEKLVREFPEARELLGRERIACRTAYRYYRLAKGRWKGGDRLGAREALRQALRLRPLSLKYRLYQLRWV
jgi:glycosyltransferase involved in cell wall biosynthesis